MKILRTCIGSMVSYGLVKELQKAGIEVIGLDSDPNSFAFQKINCYVVPKADDPSYMDMLLDIIEMEQPDAILGGAEEELLILAENRELLEDVVLLAPNLQVIENCRDKLEMYALLEQIDIPIPKLYSKMRNPCIIKNRFGRGGKGVLRIDGRVLKNLPNDIIINDVIIQEYIEGTEYSVDILADREGNVLNIVPRLRLTVLDGKSIISKTVYDREIMKYCKKIVKGLGLFGPSCIQCIRNSSGVYFIDVNPRFGGGSVLSVKADPMIIPNLIRLIEGETIIPNEHYEIGLTMTRYYKEVYTNEK